MAVGAIISAAIIGKFADRFGPITLLTAGYFGMGAISLLFWNAPTVTLALWVYVVVFGLSGIPGAALGIGMFTAVQRFSPSGMLGRVVGVAGALDALARAAGSLLAGVLVSRVDLVVLLDTQSAIYVVCGVLALLFIRDGREAYRAPEHALPSTV
jgi:MFS family permease